MKLNVARVGSGLLVCRRKLGKKKAPKLRAFLWANQYQKLVQCVWPKYVLQLVVIGVRYW